MPVRNEQRSILGFTGVLDIDSGGTNASTAAGARTSLGLVAGGAGDIWVEKAGDTMTGALTMSMADPTVTLTDTGDSNSTVLTRSDTLALASRKNTVAKPSASWATSHDGVNDVIQLPSLAWATVLGGNAGSFTIAGWFKQNSPGGANQSIFGFSPANFIFLRTGSTNSLNAVYGDAGGTTIVNSSVSVFTLDTWTHVAFVKTGSTSLEIFVNGVSKGTSAGGGTVSGTTNAFIGGLTATTQVMDGFLDEIAVWDRALTVGEIGNLYASGTGLYLITTNTFASSGTLISTNLQGLWHLDEGTGTSTADTSVNLRTGTLLQQTTFVDGKIIATPVDTAATVWTSQDGVTNLEQGIQTFGDSLGRTVIDGKTIRFNINNVEEIQLDASSNFFPSTTDGVSLGKSGNAWSDLFLATGAVLNWNAGNVTLTHAAGLLTMAGGGLVLAAGTTTLGPFKLTSGTNLTTASAGTMEYNGTNLFFTRTGTTRENVLVGNDAAAAPGTTAIGTILDFFGTSATRVLTTPNSWAGVVIGGTTYKIPLYS